MPRTLGLLSLFAILGCAVAAEKSARNGVVDAIALDKADKFEVTPRKWNAPNLITADDLFLNNLIPDVATRKRVLKEVNFETHVLLIFAWKGSGADKLESVISKGSPEQVRFSLAPGTQEDVRKHIKLFAVKKDCSWSAK